MKIISQEQITPTLHKLIMENDGGQRFPMHCNPEQLRIELFNQRLKDADPSGGLAKEFRQIIITLS